MTTRELKAAANALREAAKAIQMLRICGLVQPFLAAILIFGAFSCRTITKRGIPCGRIIRSDMRSRSSPSITTRSTSVNLTQKIERIAYV